MTWVGLKLFLGQSQFHAGCFLLSLFLARENYTCSRILCITCHNSVVSYKESFKLWHSVVEEMCNYVQRTLQNPLFSEPWLSVKSFLHSGHGKWHIYKLNVNPYTKLLKSIPHSFQIGLLWSRFHLQFGDMEPQDFLIFNDKKQGLEEHTGNVRMMSLGSSLVYLHKAVA